MSILQDLDPQYAKIHTPTKRFRWGIVVGTLSLLALMSWAGWRFLSSSSPPPRETDNTQLAIRTQSSPETPPPLAADNNSSSDTKEEAKDFVPESQPAIIRSDVSPKELPEKDAIDHTSQVAPAEKSVFAENTHLQQAKSIEGASSKPESETKPKKPHSEANREKTAAKTPKIKTKATSAISASTAKRSGERDIEIITAIMH